MKKTTFSLLLCTALTLASVPMRASTPVQEGNKQHTTLYTYGSELTSTESPLQNLFRNFPLLINADFIKLLSYEKVGTVKTKKDFKKKVKHNLLNTPKWIVSQATSSNGNAIEKSEISLREDHSAIVSKVDIKQITEGFAPMCMGDDIYLIRMVVGIKPYTYYVFVDKQTNQVYDSCNMWSFNIPVSHAKKCTQKGCQ